jgi:hypothetical protein
MSDAKNPQSGKLDTSRREFFRLAGGAVGAVALANTILPSIARGADLPHLTLDDPTAKALNYTEDATKAGAPHQAGQECSNCNFYQGGATGYGPCQLFAGKAVNAKGWCSGYAKKA